MKLLLALFSLMCLVSLSLAQSPTPVRMIDLGPAKVAPVEVAQERQFADPWVVPGAAKTAPVEVDSDKPSFKLHGSIFLNADGWHKIGDGSMLGEQTMKELSTFGIGAHGNIVPGIAIGDTFLGVGPHFGINVWFENYRGVMFDLKVQDVGGDVVIGLADILYITLGMGSSQMTLSAELDGVTEKASADASYKRAGLAMTADGGLSVGVSYAMYEDAENLNRFEFNFGIIF